MCADVNQLPRTNITTLVAAGGNCPLAPHMRLFVLCRCAGLIEEAPPEQTIRFLLGLRRSMTQRGGSAMREVVKRETTAQRKRQQDDNQPARLERRRHCRFAMTTTTTTMTTSNQMTTGMPHGLL